eukprot:gene5171-5823_t
MATNTRAIFLRAQRHINDNYDGSSNSLAKTINEVEEKQGDPTKDRLLLRDFNSKYSNPFAVKKRATDNGNNSGQSNGDVLDSVNNEESKELADAQDVPAPNLVLNPALKSAALDRFRRAGMKARLVRRVNKIVEDRLTAKQIFTRFTKESTLHGFRFIFTKTFYIRRFIWFVITVVMAAMFLKELKDSITLYFQNPFSTTSTIEYENYLTFPAISFCNLNDLRFSKINGTPLGEVYLRDDRDYEFKKNESFDINGATLASMMRKASHRIEDMFMNCIWEFSNTAANRPTPCNYTNMTAYHHTNGQLCYTFNSGLQGHRVLTLNETGLFHGFEIQLDLETHEYMRDIQEGGVRVFIHDQAETPFSSSGFAVPPGFKTFVSLGVQKIKNLPPPFTTECGSRPLKHFKAYKKSKCHLEELTNFVERKCKCRGTFMPESFDQRAGGACPEDCYSTHFSAQLSYARYVSRPPIGTSRIQIPERFQKMNLTHSQLETQIRDNIVYLIFFFPELRVENVTQTPTYDFYKLVGDVGGQLGLMLGASVLTLVEFIDLLAFIVYHQLLKLTRIRKKKKEDSITLKNTEVNGNGTRDPAFADF